MQGRRDGSLSQSPARPPEVSHLRSLRYFRRIEVLIPRFAILRNGKGGGIRTPDRQIRNLMLYPTELRPHPGRN